MATWREANVDGDPAAKRGAAFLARYPECAGWTIVPLAYASRTKKGVLGVFTRAERWCRETCAGDWRGTPQAFAFADAADAAAFRAAIADCPAL